MTEHESKEESNDIQRLAAEIFARLDQEFPALRKKLHDVLDPLNNPTAKIHKTIHKEPYWFIAAALGIGFFLGKVSGKK